VARLLGERKPGLMVTDPPYGIQLDSEWRDRAGLNGCGPAEASYMKHRSAGHTNTTISSDTRADWSEAFALAPSLQIAYVWHASVFTREVLDGLLRIGFLYPQQIIWDKGRTVLTRTHYWYQHEPCWYVRKKNAPWFGKAGENSTIWASASPKFIMGGSDEEKFDHPTQKPIELMRRPILNHLKRGELVYDPFLGAAPRSPPRKLPNGSASEWNLTRNSWTWWCRGGRHSRKSRPLSTAMAGPSRRSLMSACCKLHDGTGTVRYRDRRDRRAVAEWAPGRGRAVPGVGRLVGREAAHRGGQRAGYLTTKGGTWRVERAPALAAGR